MLTRPSRETFPRCPDSWEWIREITCHIRSPASSPDWGSPALEESGITARRATPASAWIGVLIFPIGRVWAMLAPGSFYETVAQYPLYNRHLFHDVGAFQLGNAAALLAGLGGRSGLGVALWAGAVGGSAHAVSHWIDAQLGAGPPIRH